MTRPAAFLRRLRDDRRGATAIVTALGFVSLLGFVGLGVDLGAAYAQRRTTQSAADSAAFSGAVARMAGTADVTSQARAVAATYGFKNAQNGVVVQVFSPAQSGSRAGLPDTVEVIVERPMARFFSRIFDKSATVIRARAVAVGGNVGDACVIAFNPTEEKAALLNGTADVNLIGCSLYANSTNAKALYLNGSVGLRAKSAQLVGGYYNNGSTTFDPNMVKPAKKPFADPYADMKVPDYKNLPCHPFSPPSSGIYAVPQQGPVTRICNPGIINSSATLNFASGIYVIDGGSFRTNGGATINANGVTFVLTSSSGPAATFKVNGTGALNLTPPTGGPTAGISIFQDNERPASSTAGNVVNGRSTTGLKGALYFPKQDVTFNGGNNTSGGCLQLLADKITFTGTANFEVNCAGSGVRGIGGASTELVE